MTFGLRDTDITYMHNLFRQHPDVEQVWVYGSRAKGTNRPGSDVDLALIGPDVKRQTVSHIHFVLEEDSPMPFFFDVTHWDSISFQEFKNEVKRTGKLLYERTT
jgi:predicted nucleotidyltransferase